ncbi:unnamed protein product [Peniophora sp. CBMAI 1063]|nr:unnamed protein product [Peniophora sp. CBMAI 1063]
MWLDSPSPSRYVAFVAACALGLTYYSRWFVSEPDLYGLPANVEIGAYDGDDGLYLATPVGADVTKPGPVIYDRNGSLVWIGANTANFNSSAVLDLQFQELDGQPVLTVFSGQVVDSHGVGTCWFLDDTYNVIANITSVGSTGADLHECHMDKASNKTAMLTVYNNVTFDLTSVGGAADGTLIDCWVQEVDVSTGALLFNWSLYDHISPYESYALPGELVDEAHWDAYHLNSIDKDSDGNYLLSVRHLNTLVKVNKDDGSVIWKMGGKGSNFTSGEGADFRFQHHASFDPDDNSRISLFNDAASEFNFTAGDNARGLYFSYNTAAWTTTLIQRFDSSPYQNYSAREGSMQRFADGTAVIGWGSNPWITEHASDGTVTFLLTLGVNTSNGPVENYRAYKVPAIGWAGNPTTPPKLVLRDDTAYFSWNGKTAVRSWDVRGDDDELLFAVDRAGFETNVSLDGISSQKVVVLAKDKAGVELGRSATLYIANKTVATEGLIFSL